MSHLSEAVRKMGPGGDWYQRLQPEEASALRAEYLRLRDLEETALFARELKAIRPGLTMVTSRG